MASKEFSVELSIDDFPSGRLYHSTPPQFNSHINFRWSLVTQVNAPIGEWTIILLCVPTGEYRKSYSRQRQQATGSLYFLTPSKELIVDFKPVILDYDKHAPLITQQIKLDHTMQHNMVNNSVAIRCDVRVRTVYLDPKFDFSPPNDLLLSDIVLIVGKRKFHVSKAILANSSTYFKTMFYEKFKESTESEIELNDVDFEDFQEILEVIYHKTDVTTDNAIELLKLVAYFDMKDIQEKCEQVLIRCPVSTFSAKVKLETADKYSLGSLLKHCVGDLKTVSQLKEALPRDVRDLNTETTVLLLQRIADLPLGTGSS